MMKRRIRDNQGAALVELALTAPLLLLITIGAAELGRIAYAAIEVESAARAGASYGSVNIDNGYNSTSSIQQAAYNDAPNLTSMTVSGGGPSSAWQACVCETYTSSTKTASYNPSSGTADCGSSTITGCTTDTATTTQTTITYVVVATQATVPTMFQWLPGIPNSFTVNGYSEMRVLQN